MPPQGQGRVLLTPPPAAPSDAHLPQTPFAQTNPLLSQAEEFLLGALGVRDPLAADATPARGAGALIGMASPFALMAKGAKALKTGTTAETLLTRPPVARTPIRAYHGSPHDFDKFSLSKIGTGEGAQAYGHGLYFAENPSVAKDYQQRLASGQITTEYAGRPIAPNSAQHMALVQLDKNGQPQTVEMAERWLKTLESMPNARPSELADQRKHIEWLKSLDPAKVKVNAGKTYEVAINAHPDDFLDWDKPLSQQSEKVRKALRLEVVKETEPSDSKWLVNLNGQTVEGFQTRKAAQEWADTIHLGEVTANRAQTAGPKQVSEALKAQGLKGIRYLDQGSRGSGTGTSNYVVFDDAIIEIMKKFGVAAPIAAEMLRREQEKTQLRLQSAGAPNGQFFQRPGGG